MKFKKLALALATTFGLATQAYAVPLFTVDPSSVTASPDVAIFDANFINGTSTELLQATSATTLEGSGLIRFSTFSVGVNTVDPTITGLLINYNAYLTFNIAGTLSAGSLLTPNSTYNLTKLDFAIYVDPGKNTTFTQADLNAVTHTFVAPSVGGTTGDDFLLGFGSLLTGTSTITSLGGTALNSINNLFLCNGVGTAAIGSATVDGTTVPAANGCTGPDGTDFFIAPVPFFTLAFTEANNTSSGVKIDSTAGRLAITQATAGIDFAIPEPATTALLGLGLLGLGAMRKRKAAK